MKQPLSDQEIGQIIETIAHQHASTSVSNNSFIKKRFLFGFGILSIFILFNILLMNQVSKAAFETKSSRDSHKIISFEDTTEIPSSISSTPTINTNPVQIPIVPSSNPSPTPQLLPLPIPDHQTEIRPLVPSIPLPRFILDEHKSTQENKTFSEKDDELQPTVLTTQEKKENQEKSNSIVEIQLSEAEDNF